MSEDLSKYLQDMNAKIHDLNNYKNEDEIARSRVNVNKVQEMAIPFFTKALCVDTLDFRKENRVRYYHPLLHKPDAPLESLPFAYPISAMGGIDDCGLNWVPPAGSILCLIFENGDRDSAHYIGTSWQRARDPISSKEYQKLYEGNRQENYFLTTTAPGLSFEELPSWNTESYNNYDYTDTKSFAENREEQIRFTYPNIYGFKTPEKHMLKMVDGDAKCNRRWKRVELQSGDGNWIILKDDHLHFGGQWAQGSGLDATQCFESSDALPFLTDAQGEPIEGEDGCEDSIIGGDPNQPSNPPEGTDARQSQTGSNKYFKHVNEQRPYSGPGNPQNNKCDLPQSGIQILSLSGNTMVFDDSVEEPQGKPGWQRAVKGFDYGCTDRYMGRMYIRSAHGHEIAMSDHESSTNVRSEFNYIRLKSALGNRVELNDHSIGDGACKHAGTERGIHIESTSKHKLSMIDDRNDQCGTDRKGGGEPLNKANNAYVRLESGYGSSLEFGDNNSQEETQDQFVRLMNPQAATGEDANKSKFGPHILRMQGRPSDTPGIIYLRSGGYFYKETTHNDITVVGNDDVNPEGADKYTYVTKTNALVAEDVNFMYSGKQHVLFAEDKILLLAGRDCSPADGKKCNGPCLYPVIIARCPRVCPLTGFLHFSEFSISERVFASGKQVDCSSGDEISPTGGGEGCKEDSDEEQNDNTITTGEGEVVAGQGA